MLIRKAQILDQYNDNYSVLRVPNPLLLAITIWNECGCGDIVNLRLSELVDCSGYEAWRFAVTKAVSPWLVDASKHFGGSSIDLGDKSSTFP